MKLLAIDGNSIVNRAFYGIRPLHGPDGTPTNALYGFLTMVEKIKHEVQPDAVAVAFDVHHPTFRHEAYDAYKAGRHETPDDLRTQIRILKDMLRDFEIPVIECPGYEADDVLGTLASMCQREGHDCVLYTGDKDSFQLIDDNVQVYFPKTGPGGSQTLVYDKARIAAEFNGLTPKQLIDVKALQGDTSDNIPGVAGIGPKTAVTLISKYGSIESIYNDLENLPEKDGVKEKLRVGEDSANFSKFLGTINCDAPIGVQLDDLYPGNPDPSIVYEVLDAFGLNKFIQAWNIDRDDMEID